MKRPYFTQCIVIDNGEHIWIKASIAFEEKVDVVDDQVSTFQTTPFDKISLLKKNISSLRIQGRNGSHKKIFEKDIETDPFGNLFLKIPSYNQHSRITRLQFFETSLLPGCHLLIDSIIPYKLKHPLKIVISDFDKTLVDTKYSTPKEMYLSLNRPLSYFPTIDNSLLMLRNYLKDEFQPFILSASPHFYEKPIRDWLYQNHIYTSNIFLKDYRDVFSWWSGELTPKDIKKQGFYKLDSLVDILEFSSWPSELVLMGDGFESDITVYLALRSIIIEKRDPWQVWNSIKKHDAFKLSTKQSFVFLQRLNKISNTAKTKKNMKLSIHIRCKKESYEEIRKKVLYPHFFEEQKKHINFYIA